MNRTLDAAAAPHATATAPEGVTLERALARIEELNRELGRDPGRDPVLAGLAGRPPAAVETDPCRIAAARLIKSLEETRRRVERVLASSETTAARLKKIPSDDKDDAAWLQEALDRAELARQHLAAIDDKIARLRAAPEKVFLPLGTIVRFRSAAPWPDALQSSSFEMSKVLPVPGTIGVVTMLNHDLQWPITVSIRAPFKDGYGQGFQPDCDTLPSFRVDPGSIEVLGPGLLPDGSPCKSFGFLPTHERVEPAMDGRASEMILSAAGFFWRLCRINDNVEAVAAYRNIEEMSWVGKPLLLPTEARPVPPGMGL